MAQLSSLETALLLRAHTLYCIDATASFTLELNLSAFSLIDSVVLSDVVQGE